MEKQDTENMPRTDSPRMIEIKFAVPEPLLRDLEVIAESEGWKMAELNRIVWERGFADYAEGSNKRLVNRKMRGD